MDCALLRIAASGSGVGVGVPIPDVGVGVPIPDVAVSVGVPGPGEAVAVGSPPPAVGDENGIAAERTVNCTATVCVRCPVTKTMKPAYVPAWSVPTRTSTVVVALPAICKRLSAGFTVSQAAEVKACQLILSVSLAQPAVIPKPKL